MKLEVYKPNSEVDLGDKLKGKVLSATILPNGHVTYECSWWSGKSRYVGTLEASEIEGKYEDKLEVGFK